jgi:hypothetical protein
VVRHEQQPLEFLGAAASTGLLCMSLAWVLFDFTEDGPPPPGGGLSPPPRQQ